MRFKKIIKRIFKILLFSFLFLLVLIAGLIIALQFNSTQNFISQKVINYVSGKTHSVITLKEINISFPKSIVLKDIFMEDQNHDTLLFAHRLLIDIDMMKLFSSVIELNNVSIESATAHINRSMADSSFNFDFIVNAFVPSNVSTSNSSAKASTAFSLKTVSFENVNFIFSDQVSGSDMNFSIGSLETSFKDFNLDKSRYLLNDIVLKNSNISIVESAVAIADTSSSVAFDIGFSNIDLTSINFLYQTPEQTLKSVIGRGVVKVDKINLIDQDIKINKFNLENSSLYFAFNKID
ncbi:MAG: AsmA family protein, partial [Ignavibacteria bacterium]|nr:AsmA family protein [Ignavibacteria bacterium]